MQVPGQTQSLLEHIQEGVRHASHDPTSLLLFSGGQTRKAAGPRSEAEGYWLLTQAANWWGATDVRERAYTEVCCFCDNLRQSTMCACQSEVCQIFSLCLTLGLTGLPFFESFLCTP